jgi:hypothetical protein
MEVMLMSEQMRKELKDKGFLILQTWHIFLIIASILLSTGVMIGAMQNRLNNVEIRTDKLEKFRTDQEVKNTITGEKRDRQFHEIQMNMKMLMEKQGLEYQRVED